MAGDIIAGEPSKITRFVAVKSVSEVRFVPHRDLHLIVDHVGDPKNRDHFAHLWIEFDAIVGVGQYLGASAQEAERH